MGYSIALFVLIRCVFTAKCSCDSYFTRGRKALKTYVARKSSRYFGRSSTWPGQNNDIGLK